MANYGVVNSTGFGTTAGQRAITATYQTIISMGNSSAPTGTAATTTNLNFKRGKLYDILLGTNTTPADNFLEFDVVRVTISTSLVTGPVSSVSSGFALDPADSVGFVNQVNANSSTEYTASVAAGQEAWYLGLNQRASYRWVAAPGSEIVWPAVSSGTSNGGLAVRCRSAAYTGTVTVTTLFAEQ